MKINYTFFVCLLVLASLAFAPMPGLQAQDIATTPLDVILKLSLGFSSLAGVSGLVAVLIQIGKWAGLVKDNTANRWAAGLNLVAFVVLVYFGVFQPAVAVSVLDGYALQIAQIGLFVLGFVVQMTASKPVYVALRNARVPLLAYSHSAS